MSLSAFKNTAAAVAASAIYESFPDIDLLEGGETHMGFFYDLHFPHPIHPETLSMIEQNMRQIVRERREIRILEMVPYSARELLLSQGHNFRAEQLDSSPAQLVQIVQIGSFHDLSSGEQLKNTHQLAAFKLDAFHIPPHAHHHRLTGFSYPTKEELQTFLRRLKQYPEKRHEVVGQAQGLWKTEAQEMIWLAKGLHFRNLLVQRLLQGTEQISASAQVDRFQLARFLKKPVAEVVFPPPSLFSPDAGLYGHPPSIHIFLSDPISLLHSIEKTLNILGLEHKEDLLGREWPVMTTEKTKKGFTVTLSVEKIMALLLERNTLTLERLAIENQ